MRTLSRIVKVNELTAVGFYEFQNLKECILKACSRNLELTTPREKLAPTRSAFIGLFHHRALELACEAQNKADLRDRLEMEIEKLQALVDKLPVFKKSGSVSGWTEINRSVTTATGLFREGVQNNQARKFAEKALESKDGTLVGRLDFVSIDGRRALIREYKSSALREISGEIRSEYIEQGRFYAALIYENFDLDKVCVSLEAAAGDKFEFEVIREQADSTSALLRSKRIEGNEKIRSSLDPRELASPSSKVCQFCENKIICLRYQEDQFEIAKETANYILRGELISSQNRHNDMLVSAKFKLDKVSINEINIPRDAASEIRVGISYLIDNLEYRDSNFRWTELSRIFEC